MCLASTSLFAGPFYLELFFIQIFSTTALTDISVPPTEFLTVLSNSVFTVPSSCHWQVEEGGVGKAYLNFWMAFTLLSIRTGNKQRMYHCPCLSLHSGAISVTSHPPDLRLLPIESCGPTGSGHPRVSSEMSWWGWHEILLLSLSLSYTPASTHA